MSRTTISKTIVAATLAIVLACPGCSKKYFRRPVEKDSPRAQEVRAMLGALRSAGPAGLEEVIRQQAAGGMTELQAQSLRGALVSLAEAEAVELEDMDRFGEDVYRAAFRVTAGGSSQSVCMLLVWADGRLHWAGRN
jgi:hypothetical protein